MANNETVRRCVRLDKASHHVVKLKLLSWAGHEVVPIDLDRDGAASHWVAHGKTARVNFGSQVRETVVIVRHTRCNDFFLKAKIESPFQDFLHAVVALSRNSTRSQLS